MIRYAVVGAGWIAQESFMPAMGQSASARVTAIVSGNTATAHKLADFYGIKHVVGHDEFDALVRGTLIDAVYIAVPNPLHADFAIRSARAGNRPLDDFRFQEIDAALAVTLRFPGNRLAQFSCSFGAAELDVYRVVGNDGDLTMEPGFRFETATRMRLTTRNGTETVTFQHSDHFGGQIACFSDCIVNGTPVEPDGEEGLADLRVFLAIEKAVQTGQGQTISSPARPSHPSAHTVRTVPRATRRPLP